MMLRRVLRPGDVMILVLSFATGRNLHKSDRLQRDRPLIRRCFYGPRAHMRLLEHIAVRPAVCQTDIKDKRTSAVD